MAIEWAIWGGRWQPLHLGHVAVLQQLVEQYAGVCISIVNPDPANPPVPPEEFERFIKDLTPYTYFQRAFMWHRILAGFDVPFVICPTWHPRISHVLENEFFPLASNREWCLPIIAEEELLKKKDFEKQGELVNTRFSIAAKHSGINSTQVREKLNKGLSVRRFMPVEILDLLDGGAEIWNAEFSLGLFGGDYLNARNFSRFLDLQSPIIGIPIEVSPQNDWWFKPAVRTSKLTFFEKSLQVLEACQARGVPSIPCLPILFSEIALHERSYLPSKTKLYLVSDLNPADQRLLPFLSVAGRNLGDYPPSVESYDHSVRSLERSITAYLNRIGYDQRLSEGELSLLEFKSALRKAYWSSSYEDPIVIALDAATANHVNDQVASLHQEGKVKSLAKVVKISEKRSELRLSREAARLLT